MDIANRDLVVLYKVLSRIIKIFPEKNQLQHSCSDQSYLFVILREDGEHNPN